VIFDQ
jgi:hypothetical protein